MYERVTVIGAGYLGTTHAVCMAELGYEVLGMDVDAVKVAALTEGRLALYEPDLEPLLRKHVETGRLRWTTSHREAAEFGDVHFLCVGTPQQADGLAADTTAVETAVESLAPWLTRECVLIGKSTVPVGTATRMAGRMAELAPAGRAAMLAWNPEFLREGHAIEDTMHPDRVVVGVDSARSEAILRELYASQIEAGVPFLVTDFATAELAKGAANAFLATKISFINAMAELCERAGGDVTMLADILGYDDRIGRKSLNAGVGFGGGCLPKDIRAFGARAEEIGASSAPSFLRQVDTINMDRRAHTVELARELCGGDLSGKAIAVLGAAFKPDSDDVRDSPALHIASRLHLEGAQVSVYDPKAMGNAGKEFPELRYVASARDACQGAHVVLLLTEWREFRHADPAMLAGVVERRNVIDGRNALDERRWAAAGWTYRALGKG